MSNNKKKVAVLISGYGGNLQALINACKLDEYPAKIDLVISNKEDAYGLQRAEVNGIENLYINHKSYKSRAEFDEAMHKELTAREIDIVCLAGFMRLLSAEFVNKWDGRMINIHPSLLPAFKGANAVEDALAAGAKKTGCTVHYVIPEMDAGEIIVQRELDIIEGQDISKLYERIHEHEHIAYPEALKIVCSKL